MNVSGVSAADAAITAILDSPKKPRKFEYNIAEFPSAFARAFMLVVPDQPPHDVSGKEVARWSERTLREKLEKFEKDIGVDRDWIQDLADHVAIRPRIDVVHVH